MIKIAISGYNGWIAKNLEKKLKKYEFGVIGIDRKLLYAPSELELFFLKNKPSIIIHTAAYGNYADQQNDMECMFANVFALMNMLQASRSIDYDGFINFSSSSVNLPYETFYSATKAAGERIVRAFVNKYDKPVISVRPYTVIGKGETPKHLIPTLIRSCLKGEKMKFVTDPVHDYIDIDDFCEGVVILLSKCWETRGFAVEIGTGKSTTNQEVREIVEKVTGKKANVDIVKKMRMYDSEKWVANTAVMDILKFVPKKTIEDSVKEMVMS